MVPYCYSVVSPASHAFSRAIFRGKSLDVSFKRRGHQKAIHCRQLVSLPTLTIPGKITMRRLELLSGSDEAVLVGALVAALTRRTAVSIRMSGMTHRE